MHLSLRLLQVQNSMAKKEFRSRSTTNIANNLKTLKASYTHLKLKLFFHLAFLNLNGHSKPLSFFKKKLLPSWDLLYLWSTFYQCQWFVLCRKCSKCLNWIEWNTHFQHPRNQAHHLKPKGFFENNNFIKHFIILF